MATFRVPVLEDFSWQPPVIDKDLVTAPTGVGVLKGHRYIVAANGGNWSGGVAKDIATAKQADPSEAGHWMFDTPAEGWFVYVTDEHKVYRFNNSSVWDIEDISALEADVTSIDTRVSNVESSVGSIDTNLTGTDSSVGSIDADVGNVESSVGSIDTRVSANESVNTVQSTAIVNTNSSVGSIDTHVNSCDSSIVSINTRATNIESSVGSINTAKQDKGTYVSEYGCIEFTI